MGKELREQQTAIIWHSLIYNVEKFFPVLNIFSYNNIYWYQVEGLLIPWTPVQIRQV